MSMFVCASVCICLSVREHNSGAIHARSLPNILCMLPMDVARSSSRGVTKSQGEGAIWGVSSLLTLRCNAFAANGIGREGVMGVHSAGEM